MYGTFAICPCCNKTAVSATGMPDYIDALFGWRYPEDPIPQAYCRECRSAKCSSTTRHCGRSYRTSKFLNVVVGESDD